MRFRVWDGERMWYPEDDTRVPVVSAFRSHITFGYFVGQDGDLWKMVWDYDESPELVENGVVMSSTGRKDSNGKEVWDGDILEFCSFRGMVYETSNGEVLWKHSQWHVERDSDWTKTLKRVEDCSDLGVKIIGNIYENPSEAT